MTQRDKIQAIARIICDAFGYVTPEDADFETSTNPRIQGAWQAACRAWEEFTGDSPDLDADFEN